VIDPIHLISFDVDAEIPTVTFKADYRPTTGPLPELSYPLVGLWVYNGLVVRALFEAPTVPTHEREPILHRYEGPTIVHQGQARYRYFTVPGYAGMVLTPKGFAAAGVPVHHMWASLSEATNSLAYQEWANNHDTHIGGLAPSIVRLNDLLGGLPPIHLCVPILPEERLDPLEHRDPDPQPLDRA
jgi:hypothetical protein